MSRQTVTLIRPRRSWLRIPWREIAEYRDLLWIMIRRDFSIRYKQTLLGPAWYVIQPLLHTAVFTVVFARWAKVPTDAVPPPLFYLAGSLIWNYFAQSLSTTANTLVGNASLFGKVYFPRLIIPISKVISGLFGLLIQAVTLAGFWIYFKVFTAAGPTFTLRPTIVLLPVWLLQSGALALGVGLWLSAGSAKYRDLAFVVGFLTQLWMYATPVIWPLSMLPPRARTWAVLNPMAVPVEACRSALLGTRPLLSGPAILSGVLTFALLLSGIFVFNRTERSFMDTV